MVAHDVLRVVDHTTAIAGEQATGMNGVEITPRVDTVAAWHDAAGHSPPPARPANEG